MECVGRPHKRKNNPEDLPAKYWGTQTSDKPFVRSDGAISVDKTKGFHSRPGAKEKIRQANRAINKAARQIFKRNLDEELNE